MALTKELNYVNDTLCVIQSTAKNLLKAATPPRLPRLARNDDALDLGQRSLITQVIALK